MNEQAKIRWGIIGAGNIAHKLAEAVQLDPDSALLSVASRTPAKAAGFAAEYGITAAADYETLLNNPDIDVVYIATTHNFHYENALLALSKGKNLLIEKAFTVNAGQARELVELARRKGLFLMEAIWIRFLPSMLALKKTIAEGGIGELQHLRLDFGGITPPQYRTRLVTPELAGGVTLDMGIYPISFICYVVGELPCEIKSMARFSDTGVDELALYQFRFPCEATAAVSTSYNLAMKSEAMVYGNEGYIEYPGFQQGSQFKLHRHAGTGTVTSTDTVVAENHRNGFVYQVAEVVACLRAGKLESAVIPLDETIGIMAIMDRMRAEWGFQYPFE